MTSVEELKTLATSSPLEGGKTEAVICLDEAREIDRMVHALTRFFAEDGSHMAVLLDFQGQKLGYLNRRDFYHEKSEHSLGRGRNSEFASSQGYQLPGAEKFEFIKLSCPVEGCGGLILRIHYDERDPPRCSVHQDKILEIVS